MSGRPSSFIPLYIGDYMADTSHLTAAEHGAYLLLIFHYWRTGESLPDNEAVLSRIARMTKQEWNKSGETIRAFFKPAIVNGVRNLIHSRIEHELLRAAGKYEQAAEAGRRSAEARRLAKERIERANGIPTPVERPLPIRCQSVDDPVPTERPTKRQEPQPQPHSPDGEDSSSKRERSNNLVSRIAEILELKLDPVSRAPWDRGVFAALSDGLSETELIRGAEVARANGKAQFPYIRAVALKIPKNTQENTNERAGQRTKKPSSTDSHLAGIARLVAERRNSGEG